MGPGHRRDRDTLVIVFRIGGLHKDAAAWREPLSAFGSAGGHKAMGRIEKREEVTSRQ